MGAGHTRTARGRVASAIACLSLVAATLAPFGAPPAIAAPGEDTRPAPNPDMQQACGMDALIILDESGSVENYTENVRDAFRAFTSALRNTGSRIAVTEFSTVARLPLTGAAQRAYTTVTDASIASIFEPYISNFYRPGGSTNWEDSLRVGRYFLPRPSASRPHITVFITDGDPNRVIRTDRVTFDPGNPNVAENEYELLVPLSDNDTTDASNSAATTPAVPNANALKATGSHVLAVAVGAALNNQQSLNRLIQVSGPDVVTTGQPLTPQTDVYRVPNFAELEQGLRNLAFALCAPVVNVQKLIDVTPDPGTNDAIPAGSWQMTGVVSPTPASWAQPVGATGSTAVGETRADGFISFDWRPSGAGAQSITVTEEDPGSVPPGFFNDPASTACTYRTPQQPNDTPLPITTGVGTFTAVGIPQQAIVTCRMVNRLPPDPGITLEKYTNGADADDPTGPFVPVGDDVTWSYVVTNTGNVTLSSIALTDTVTGTTSPVTCEDPIPASLPPTESFTCEVTGTAVLGQYENTGTVNAVDPFGTGVSATDPSHYLGVVSTISIVKSTNGFDADLPPGPPIPVGGAVNWTYLVTNTGTTALTGVAVTDDQGVAVTCPATVLAAGASMTCTASGIAVAGQYENVGSVSAVDPLSATVRDSNASHYFGEDPSIDLEKFTGTDPADTPTGPFFAVGDTVTWIYEMTNTGNVPLRWSLGDNQPGVGLACPRLLFILPGQSIFCHGSAPAEAGQHENIATVSTTTPSGTVVPPVTDPANYFGVQGAISLVKSTNGDDANEAPGPYITPGGAVTWTYLVTNTGNSALSDIVVTDLKGVAVTCPSETLATGASMTCTASGVAEPDQYTNLAHVEGVTLVGQTVRDDDPSHYFGAVPGIDLQKLTNGLDADDPTGPFIEVGEPVEWDYIVTNSGNTALTGLVVTDDQGVVVTCPQTTLAVGEVVTCTGTGTSELGQYANLGTASATSNAGPVSSTDPSHYFGFVSQIQVTKLVNGDDANTAPGLELDADDPLTFTYEVSNPGNILIRDVVLVDDQGLVPVFIGGDGGVIGELEPGETWTYEATSTAVAGTHTNIATVTGLDLLEQPVTDDDPANYTAEGPEPALLGDTVWEDLNQDGDQDADEPGIEGARVDITSAATADAVTVTTDATGHYRAAVAPGTYEVVLDMTSVNSVLTTPGSYTLTLGPGDEDLSADFGVFDDSGELPNTSTGAPMGAPLAALAAVGLLLVCAAHARTLALRRVSSRLAGERDRHLGS